MSEPQTRDDVAHVFLIGDPSPVPSLITVDELAALIADSASMAADTGAAAPFIRFPGPFGDILVRPDQIVALLPCAQNEEDE